MTIYTAEINGRGIAAFDAVDLVAAEDWAHGPQKHGILRREVV
jgi:hypothetical protein